MKLILKSGVMAVLAVAVVSFGASEKAAVAGEYPDKTIRAIVPFGAGGGTDRWVRVMSSVGFDFFAKACGCRTGAAPRARSAGNTC